MSLKPIPTTINNNSPEKKSLKDLPDVILGAGIFNYQYNENPDKLGAEEILAKTFDLGIRALGMLELWNRALIWVFEAVSRWDRIHFFLFYGWLTFDSFLF